MNPRSLFLFPGEHKLVYKVREALIEALNHDVTFSSAVNAVLAYGFVAMLAADQIDKEKLRILLREIDIFASPDSDLDKMTQLIEQRLREEVGKAEVASRFRR